MKILPLAIVLVLLPLAPVQADSSIYRWTDVKGITHFTDNPENIPKRYRNKAKQVELMEEPATRAASPREKPAEAAAPVKKAPAAKPSAGGHPQEWWRARFAAVRGELKTLKEGLPEKEAKAAEAKRKRVIFMRAQDRLARNAANDAVDADQQRIDQLQKQLSDLELEADKAGVPAEWRQ